MWWLSARKESAVLSGFEGVCGVALWCLVMFGLVADRTGVAARRLETNPKPTRKRVETTQNNP